MDSLATPGRRGRTQMTIAVIAAVTGVVLLVAAVAGGCAITRRQAAGIAAAPSGEAGEVDATASAAATPSVTASPAPGACGRYAFDKPGVAGLRSAKKKAFAFYFPPYPISIENKPPAGDYWAKWTTEEGRGATGTKQGEELLDRPIGRSPLSSPAWRQKDFETEIRQAIAMGLDGFIWEYHSVSSDARWTRLPEMLAAAKAVDPGFRIMLSPDLQQGADTAPEQIVTDMLKVKNETALHRVDGKIVMAPFYPERKTAAWWDGVRSTLAAQGVPTVLVPIFLSGSPNVRAAAWNASVHGYSIWGNRWVGGADSLRKGALEAHAHGRAYMAPIAFEDTRVHSGRFWESSNSGALRAQMEKAIAGGADWLALITWNDYSESWMAPSVKRGYAVGDLVAYYTTWFKTGKRPALKRDALYYFHRSHRTDAPYDTSKQQIAMRIDAGDPATDNVELLAFLSAPGRLVIRQGGTVRTKDVAAAGMVSFTAPMVPGTTPSFEIQRAGATVRTLVSKTPIRARVTYQEMMYHAGGGTACR